MNRMTHIDQLLLRLLNILLHKYIVIYYVILCYIIFGLSDIDGMSQYAPKNKAIYILIPDV